MIVTASRRPRQSDSGSSWLNASDSSRPVDLEPQAVLAPGGDLADHRASRWRPRPSRTGPPPRPRSRRTGSRRESPFPRSNAARPVARSRSVTAVMNCAFTRTRRWPDTNSARSHQCEPMSANARDAPPRSPSTRQLSSSGRSSQSWRYVPWISRTGPVLPCADARPRFADGRVVAVDERHGGLRFGGRRRVDEALRLARVHRQRLLADHVLARGERGFGERRVKVVRRADVDHVHLVGVDQRLSGLEAALGAERRRGLRRTLGRRGGDADQTSPGQPGRASVHGADEPRPYDPYPQRSRHGRTVSGTLSICQANVWRHGAAQCS